jgi:tetratricopeptide (TPR) repeat protein
MLVLLAKQQRGTVFPASVTGAYPKGTPYARILYDQLKGSGFDLGGLAQVEVEYKHNPETAGEESEQDKYVADHCRKVFDLAAGSLTPGQRRVLKLHALLSHGLLPGGDLAEMFGMDGHEGDLVTLADLGWLDEGYIGEGDGGREERTRGFSMHQVIAAAIRATPPPPSDKETGSLACAVASKFSFGRKDSYIQNNRYLPHGKALLTRFGATETADIALLYNNTGYVYQAKGDYPRAIEYYTRALEIRERVLGEEHPDTAKDYNNIGVAYYGQGDYPLALEHYTHALEIRERVLGEEHPATAISNFCIGQVYYSQGSYNLALEYHTRALAIRKRVLGEEHPATARSYNEIGYVHYSQGSYNQALEYFDRALEINKCVNGDGHSGTVTVQENTCCS